MPDTYAKLKGSAGRLFADPQPPPDETSFQVDNASSQYYQSPYYLLHQKDLQPVPKPRTAQPQMDLSDVLGSDISSGRRSVRVGQGSWPTLACVGPRHPDARQLACVRMHGVRQSSL